ncbi:hypothetical protein F0L74_15910 [Chitinophaga agrisoli]|uniref:Tail specific protease domain-containing protein n=1 Tax=Chitinophaga agrisoli TaxID=2607653 RepID=A0A5B2VSY3_9BACT|nr:S41 family peptidase [Chitinophaga agrisoli]KAA2241386.1 hypothetical protein F0L74_15910 [Chitinophaga agrisoli]
MRKRFTPAGIPMLLVGLVLSSVFFSCKKDNPGPGDNGGNGTARSDEDSLKYLMYNIMQVTYADGGRNSKQGLPTYYWYTQVPTLDPFSSNYPKAEDLLTTMISYPKQDGKNLDRYSFLDRTGDLANKLQNGIIEKVAGDGTGDLGMEVTYALDNANRTHLVVLYADKNSPAGQAGVQRGWEITAINGNTNISYDGANGPNTQRVNAALTASSASFTFSTPGGATSKDLSAGSYNVNPVLFDTVYNVGGKQVGYFVLYTFSSVTNTSGAATPTKTVLDQVFNNFRSRGITELIADFRYNTGGAVTTAQYLDNIIAPATARGKVMYNYIYNDKISQNLAATGLPASIKFDNTPGGLGLNHVFFVTGGETASASELTLNNLKPYMNVKLVGDTTYGKPVGFFNYTISDYPNGKENYLGDLYAINFETKNANQQGGYYNGIAPDATARDVVSYPWGDQRDEHLSKIFAYINGGSFREAGTELRTSTNPSLRVNIPGSIPSRQFNGMIDFR